MSGTATLQDALARTTDEKISKIVAVIDAMTDRGEADALLAPIRPRLAQLRPARPMRLSRLFYLPLDPLIVPAEQWQPGALTLPRALLPHLTSYLERTLGTRAALLQAAVRQLVAHDEWSVHALGRILWPEASALLLGARFTPDEIARCGFAAADHRLLANAVGRLLAHAVPLRDLVWRQRANGPPAGTDMRRLIEPAIPDGPMIVAMLLALMADAFPRARTLYSTAEQLLPPALAPAIEQVAEHSISLVEAALAPARLQATDPARLSQDMAQLDGMLTALEYSVVGTQPDRRARIAALRQRLDGGGLAQFQAALDQGLLTAAEQLAAPITDAQVATLESLARDLRRMEQAAQASPVAADYRRLLDAGAQRLANLQCCGLTKGDRMRLAEILGGSDSAETLFSAA